MIKIMVLSWTGRIGQEEAAALTAWRSDEEIQTQDPHVTSSEKGAVFEAKHTSPSTLYSTNTPTSHARMTATCARQLPSLQPDGMMVATTKLSRLCHWEPCIPCLY